MAKQQEPTLSDVRERYEHWRSDKTSGNKIPEDLWRLARKLVGRYSPSKIRDRLRISSMQYKRYILQEQAEPPLKPEQQPFVSTSLNQVLSTVSAHPYISINCQDGTVLTINNLPIEQIGSLINQLLERFSCCK